MNDLFKKLNVLVRAGVNELLGSEPVTDRPRRLKPEQLGKDIDREITALRQRINEALTYEDELQARVQSVSSEVARWDQQADEAVAAGNDAAARHAIDQMQSAQKRLAMAESDLHEHRVVTQELISRVNMLEAAVADARRAQDESAPVSDESPGASLETAGQALSDVLREAREKIGAMSSLINAPQQSTPESSPESTTSTQSVEDDLARRRERLSKPK
jgi:phage shock protein A